MTTGDPGNVFESNPEFAQIIRSPYRPIQLLLVFLVLLAAFKSFFATLQKYLEVCKKSENPFEFHSSRNNVKSTILISSLLMVSFVFCLSTIPLFIFSCLQESKSGQEEQQIMLLYLSQSLLKASDFTFELVEYMLLLVCFFVGWVLLPILSKRLAVLFSVISLICFLSLSFTATLVQPLEFPSLDRVVGRLDIGWCVYYKIGLLCFVALIWRDCASAAHPITDHPYIGPSSSSSINTSFTAVPVAIGLLSIVSLFLQLCTFLLFPPVSSNQILIRFILAALDSWCFYAVISFLLVLTLPPKATSSLASTSVITADTKLQTPPFPPTLVCGNQNDLVSNLNLFNPRSHCFKRPSEIYSLETARERDICSTFICSTNLNSSIPVQDQANSLFRC